MSEIFRSYKRQGKTVSNRTFDYGSSVRAAQNDKLVAKEDTHIETKIIQEE
jgi:hypothetical protein